jgi:hypothetical protein
VTEARVELWSKTVGIVGGLLSAVGLVWGLFANVHEQRRQLRWEQAKYGRELVGAMLADPPAKAALLMLDYESRAYEVRPGDTTRITSATVWTALDTANVGLEADWVFVRDSFDRLLYHVAGLEHAVRTELVEFDDVRYPLGYYVAKMRGHEDVVRGYARAFGYGPAADLLARFDAARGTARSR